MAKTWPRHDQDMYSDIRKIRNESLMPINFEIIDLDIICTCEVISEGKTGVEIEALFATEVALLTIYDMCKYIDRNMIIKEVKLLMKKGGKSGDFKREKIS